jgi:hypothetical protein
LHFCCADFGQRENSSLGFSGEKARISFFDQGQHQEGPPSKSGPKVHKERSKFCSTVSDCSGGDIGCRGLFEWSVTAGLLNLQVAESGPSSSDYERAFGGQSGIYHVESAIYHVEKPDFHRFFHTDCGLVT